MNLFTIKRCEICRAELFSGKPFCATCFNKLRELQLPERIERSDYVIFSLFNYGGDIQDIIQRMKFHGQRYLAAVLAEFIVTFIKRNELPVDQVSFVPMYRKKRWVRGYNQAKDLALETSKRLDIPLIQLLERNRSTKSLYELGRIERRRILEGAMNYLPDNPTGYTMIIDDILTTGSTIDACAKALSQGGREDYFFLVVAKAIQ